MSETTAVEVERVDPGDRLEVRRRAGGKRGSLVALAGVVLAACVACSSSRAHGSSAGGASGTAPAVALGPASHASTPALSRGGGGAFCGDVRRATIAAARIARSLTTYAPDQIREAVNADQALETTAAAEAPADIRQDVLVASDAHQFQALARAGYDFSKVNPADLATSPLQEAALDRVRTYVISHCGYDPRSLVPAPSRGNG